MFLKQLKWMGYRLKHVFIDFYYSPETILNRLRRIVKRNTSVFFLMKVIFFYQKAFFVMPRYTENCRAFTRYAQFVMMLLLSPSRGEGTLQRVQTILYELLQMSAAGTHCICSLLGKLDIIIWEGGITVKGAEYIFVVYDGPNVGKCCQIPWL